ncbi:hypothetical protein RHSIM_Rhsim07G0026900 [Rhododendron simsii]|uniref:Uncharacterized protein n=1 Tax=Rhododendron simsii TaxID=118357 RepID=A0A834GLS0_RHOSS|nr:hypothetical protein RHSIM_Rhsim07G0026900 [Rhododendron simsii]
MSLRGERMMKVVVAQFYGIAVLSGKERVRRGGGSNSDTENCSDKDEDDNVGNTEGESISDGESKGGDRVFENNKSDDGTMDEDYEATQEDSTG